MHLIEGLLSLIRRRKPCTTRRTFIRDLDQVLFGQLLQLFNRVDGSQRRGALCRVQSDVVFGPCCNDLGVHGGGREKATEMKTGVSECLNTHVRDI